MSQTITKQRKIKIYKFKGMYGYIHPKTCVQSPWRYAADKTLFVELKEMKEIIEVSEDQLQDTGKTATLEWEEPI